jgi:lysyl-tRNA synthetase class 2
MTDSDGSVATDENKLIVERRAKLAELRTQGNAFPNDFRRTATASELQSQFAEHDKESLEAANQQLGSGRYCCRDWPHTPQW